MAPPVRLQCEKTPGRNNGDAQRALKKAETKCKETTEKTQDVFITVLTTTGKMGTMYTDLTGPFPYTSAKGNKYIFVTYSYDGNAVLQTPVKNRSTPELKKAYEKAFKQLEQRGIKPKINIMDNKAAMDIKQ